MSSEVGLRPSTEYARITWRNNCKYCNDLSMWWPQQQQLFPWLTSHRLEPPKWAAQASPFHVWNHWVTNINIDGSIMIWCDMVCGIYIYILYGIWCDYTNNHNSSSSNIFQQFIATGLWSQTFFTCLAVEMGPWLLILWNHKPSQTRYINLTSISIWGFT